MQAFDTSIIFKPDGTLRYVGYGNASSTRAAVLQITKKSRRLAKEDRLATSFIVDAQDFDAVYLRVVNLLANHYGVADDAELVKEMLATKDLFLKMNGLVVRPVCYMQVSRAESSSDAELGKPA